MKNSPTQSAAGQFFLRMVLALTLVAQAYAQSADTSCPPPPMPLEQQMAYIDTAPAKNAGFLWRLEKEGRSSWLYGTMHLNHIDYAKPGPQIMAAMRQSDVLAVELDITVPQTLGKLDYLADFKLSSDQWARLGKAYAKDCLPFDPTKILSGSATSPLMATQAQRQSLFAGYSPDARLIQIAKRTAKPVVALETATEQIKALAPVTQTELDARFSQDLDAIESGVMQTGLLQLNKAWQANDWSAIEQLAQEAMRQQPALYTRLLGERNVPMADKIDELHQAGKRVFVAVGAMHMAGQTALPKLLQDKGYRVSFLPLR